jgi:integrase
MLATGIDPMAERKEAKGQKRRERAAENKAAQNTFEKLARQWFAWWKTDKSERYAGYIEKWLEGDVIGLKREDFLQKHSASVEAWLKYDKIPHIGGLRPEKITRQNMIQLAKAVDERGARDIAQRILQVVCQIYVWAIDNGHLDEKASNPAAGIKATAILSKHVTTKFAHLKIAEVPELLVRMREHNGNALTRIAMELLSLTFVRPGELIQAPWKEIDWEHHAWLIPEERMKMRRPHVVPLSIQAMTLLKRLQAISGEGEFLFPDTNSGLGSMSHSTINMALRRMGYGRRMTGHGWRYIASTYLRTKRYDKFLVELQLSHVEGGVAGIYNEWEVFEERAQMMQAWADALDEMRDQRAGKMRLVLTAA